jgi:hypothetical protein
MMRIRMCICSLACFAGVATIMVGCEPAAKLPPAPNAPVATGQPGPARSTPPAQTAAATTPPQPGSRAQSPMAPAMAQSPMAPGQQTPIAPGQQLVKPAQAFDANLIANGSFEYLRDDGTPGGWAVTEGLVTSADGPAQHGEHALTLASSGDNYGILSYNTPVAAADLGKEFRVSAWAISASHWKLAMDVEAVQNGETVQLGRKGWSEAPDDWQPLELTAELPADIDPESVRVRFVVAKEPGLTFKLDNVRAEIALLGNRSFEAKDEDGRPLGWGVSPASTIQETGDANAIDGNEVLTLESVGDSWAVVAQPLAVTADDLGRDLTVAAHGQAPISRGMFIGVRCSVDGEDTDLGMEPWLGVTSEWTQVQSTVTLPEDADPSSVQLRIIVRDEAGHRYLIDNVQAKLD